MRNRINEAYNRIEEAINTVGELGLGGIYGSTQSRKYLEAQEIAVYPEEVCAALRAYLEAERTLSKKQVREYRKKLGDFLVNRLIQNSPKENPNAYKTLGEIEFSTRVKNCLNKLIRDKPYESCILKDFIKNYSEYGLFQCRGFGRTSLREVKRTLADLGLALRE